MPKIFGYVWSVYKISLVRRDGVQVRSVQGGGFHEGGEYVGIGMVGNEATGRA